MVRAKINGQGPFNFIVDTGCPLLLVSASVGKKLGLQADGKNMATLDRFELEGGLVQTKVPARIETPFQIEGMNSMGLAGVELHGLMGYTVLAKYRFQIDFTRDRMAWTPLAFEPPPPAPLGAKTGTAGMDMMVMLVRALSFLAGNLGTPPAQPRGFCGFELTEKDGRVLVERVLPKTPAAEAGLKAGDRIVEVEGKVVLNAAAVQAGASKITAGKMLRLTIRRGEERQQIRITAGDGL
jgi:membrane-associated protease RseP (regulator of RpoE activity)